METHGVVPDVIDEAPAQVVQVTYPSGVKVDMGSELTPTQVKDVPSVSWPADPTALYTLCMSGLHRYIFLVYKQPGRLQCDEPRLGYSDREGRRNFSIRKFASKYKLGQPVAGNFFQAQWDEYVATLSSSK